MEFLSDLNKIILDSESEYFRLEQGSKLQENKKKDVANVQIRMECKEKLKDGTYSSQQYHNCILNTIG